MTPLNGADTLYSNYPDDDFSALDAWEPTIDLCRNAAWCIDTHVYQKVTIGWRACRSSVESYL